MSKADSASIISIDTNNAFWACRLNPPIQNLKQILSEVNNFSENLAKTHQLVSQIFNLNEAVSIEHINLVISRVHNVFQQKINISNHPNMEFLLYLSGQRQIKRALEIAGINPQGDPIEIGFTVFGDLADLQHSLPEIRVFLSKYTIEPIPSRSKAELGVFLQKHSNLKNALRVLQCTNYTTENISSFQELMDTISPSVVEQIICDIMNEQMIKVQMSNLKLKGEK